MISRSKLDSMNVKEMRKLCRQLHPECRGSKYIRRDDMIRILTKTAQKPAIQKSVPKKAVIKSVPKPIKTVRQAIQPVVKPIYVSDVEAIIYMTHPKLAYNYLLIGENHTVENTKCSKAFISADDWIMRILRQQQQRDIKQRKFIDLFIEYHYNVPEKYFVKQHGGAGLATLPAKLRYCLEIDKTRCPFKDTARIHYADIRNYNSFSDIIVFFHEFMARHSLSGGLSVELPRFIHAAIIPEYDKILSMIETYYVMSDKPDIQKVLLKTLLSHYTKKPIIYIIKHSHAYMKIKKQIAAIHYKKFRHILTKYLDRIVTIMDIKWKTFRQNPNINFVFISLFKGFSKLVDIYILARTLRTYKNSRNPRHPKYSYNNIIFTGVSHTLNMRTLLKQMGFQLKFMGIPAMTVDIPGETSLTRFDYSTHCVDIQKLHYP